MINIFIILKDYLRYFLICFWFLKTSLILSQENFTPNKITDNQITLDGYLNEEFWSSAAKVPFDIEFSPANNEPSRIKTFGYISYSKEFIYVGIDAKVDPKNIRASVRQRDDMNMLNDDFIALRFDTFRDARNNIVLGVNALGSQLDARQINEISEDKRYDISFNINFQSFGNIVEDGYQIEIKIPFSEIEFPNGNDQTWHFNFYERYFEDGNVIELSSQIRDRDNPCLVCQTTDVIKFNDVTIKKRFELLPYLYSNISGSRSSNDQKIIFNKPSGNLGIGLNLDINKNTSLEVTLNPDFSQVEADVTQIDANSSFSLRYPERRPFFNRGTDLVNFVSGTFYSRSIVNPVFASKLFSQFNKSRIFLLNAIDENSPYLVGGEDRSYEGFGDRSFVNILRYQYLLDPKSRLGAFTTNRLYNGGGYGHSTGLDGLFLFSSNWRFNFEYTKSFNQEPNQDWIVSDAKIYGKTVRLDGDNLDGYSLYMRLYRNTEHWRSYFYYRDISPQFRADVGFVVQNNRRWTTFFHEYINILNKPALQKFGFGTKIDRIYTFDAFYKAFSADFFTGFTTFGRTELKYTLDYDAVKTFLRRTYYHLQSHTFLLRGAPYEQFNFELEYTLGKELSVNEEVPEVGRIHKADLSINFQINDNFNITPLLRYSRLENLSKNENYFEGSILRLNFKYQFSNYLNIRLVAENNSFINQFYIQPLIQWNPNPSTIFYLGANQNTLEEIDDITFSLFQFNRSQIFFKFQYLIGL